MALISSQYLKNLASTKSFSQRERMFSESKKTHVSFDIFLSHSFLDKDEVEGLYIELTNLGYSVYVDWIIDPQLDRKNVTKQSASLIKDRMKASKSLLLAMSSNAEISKWIPWELGFIDGKTNKCAIIPVSKDPISQNYFKRSEYLLLYPYIKQASIDSKKEYYIVESSNYFVSFDSWSKRNLTPSFNSLNIDIL